MIYLVIANNGHKRSYEALAIDRGAPSKKDGVPILIVIYLVTCDNHEGELFTLANK